MEEDAELQIEAKIMSVNFQDMLAKAKYDSYLEEKIGATSLRIPTCKFEES